MPGSMKEHFDFWWIVMGFLFTGLGACGLFIFNGMRTDLKEVKDSLKEISSALSERLTRCENDLNRLWGEHRATHYQASHAEMTRHEKA